MSSSKCKTCSYFFPIPENADDFAAGKGDCVTEVEDEKGKFWLSKAVFETSDCCSAYKAK